MSRGMAVGSWGWEGRGGRPVLLLLAALLAIAEGQGLSVEGRQGRLQGAPTLPATSGTPSPSNCSLLPSFTRFRGAFRLPTGVGSWNP